MKKLIALLLALSICALCGCGGSNDTPNTAGTNTTEDPIAESVTQAPGENSGGDAAEGTTEAPTEPVVLYTNPLTGEALEAPITTRPVSVSINNIPAALPHRGVVDADIYFESFVNGSIIRGLAIYADISQVGSIGSVRSARPILIDLSKHYNAFYAHAGGSSHTYDAFGRYGIDHMNVDTGMGADPGYAYRDATRKGYDYEHTLFIRGQQLMDHIINVRGVDMTQAENAGFNLTFAADGTPEGGETANTVTIKLKYGASIKDTVMVYNEESGMYEYNQYGQTMYDADSGEAESFENVIVMYTDMYMNGGYHYANFTKGGTGYYACGGKIIPIQWFCDGADQPFRYTTMDGEVLTMGIGSSYIALTCNGAPVLYE